MANQEVRFSSRAYVSGAHTGIERKDTVLRKFYVDVALCCNNAGLGACIPHLAVNRPEKPDYTPRETSLRIEKDIVESRLLIAYVGVNSTDVGFDMALAQKLDLPIVLVYGNKVVVFDEERPSQRILGTVGVVRIVTGDMYAELISNMTAALREVRQKFSL